MFVVPLSWHVQTNGFNLFEAYCEINHQIYICAALSTAVTIIEDAIKFKGVPYPERSTPPNNVPNIIRISFSIMFPSKEHLTNFMQYFKEH